MKKMKKIRRMRKMKSWRMSKQRNMGEERERENIVLFYVSK